MGNDVVYSGIPGAYAEIAAMKYFGSGVKLRNVDSFSEVFLEIGHKGALGIAPIENTIEGSVNEVYDLLLRTDGVKIVGEEVIRVSHCLIANPESMIEEIRNVYSHPQALAQCREFIEKMRLKPLASTSTASGVKLVKELNDKTNAAIASRRASDVNNMKVLAANIESHKDNYTRFVILSQSGTNPSGNDKTSLVLSIANKPGKLLKALAEIATADINMTKIESRPILGKPWEYHFYLDIEGHLKDYAVSKAIRRLAGHTSIIKVLGSYKKAENINAVI
ncbi:MAG: prephenate dehydratase [Candidatus Micrarchaeota archaeon]|nr:prephenate dehydratase [Candidatus Micrarchaeota archaeon]